MPHKGMQQVIKQAKRFNWLAAGRRWRKTTLMMSLAVDTAINGKFFLWGAPTFDQVRIGWNEARRAAGNVFTFRQSTMTATLEETGGMIVFRSMDDPDNARGHTADRVGLDEIADINPIAYYEVLRPMLIDTGGDFFGKGTPKGRNWFFREHNRAKSLDDSMSWQVPTKGCRVVDGELIREPHPLENPDIEWSEIVNLFETLPISTFNQEILAQFIENEGAVFRNIGACLGAPMQSDHAGHTIVAGLDWGKHKDFTAISIGCVNCKHEIARDRFNQIDYTFQRDRIRTLHNKYNVGLWLAESNAMGEPNIEQMLREGIPVNPFATTATTKPPLIENLALILEREEWQFQDDPIWTSELEAYERKVSATTNRSSYSAPEGMNDDTVIARALMVRAADGSMLWTSY